MLSHSEGIFSRPSRKLFMLLKKDLFDVTELKECQFIANKAAVKWTDLEANSR